MAVSADSKRGAFVKRTACASLAWPLFATLLAACSTTPRQVSASLSDASGLSAGDAGMQLDAGAGGSSAQAGRDRPTSPGGGDAAVPADPCLGVSCNAPPATLCADASTLRTYATEGSCSQGECSHESHDEACAFGCTQGACAADPCAGQTCTSPPGDRCQDDGNLHVYDRTGSCEAGDCTYASRVVACTCTDDACTTDPCPSITCDRPPAASCTDANTLRSFAAIGVCSGGACSYEPSDSACPFGCEQGACNPDPCAGVTCTTPPGPSCPTSTSRRSHRSPGTCSQGTCSYMPLVTECESNQRCSSGACVDNAPVNCLQGITGYDAAGPFSFAATSSGSVKLWLPNVPAGCKVPVVSFANATGGNCGTYKAILEHLASHGFLGACYESTQTGAGTVGLSALETAFAEHADLADSKIGSMGHSSNGGQAAFVVVKLAEDRWGNAMTYAGFSMEPASGSGAQPSGGTWQQVYAEVDSPMFMFSGTSDILVSPAWVRQAYDALADDVEAYLYSGVGATNIPVPVSHANQAAVAWFRWQLLGDQSACAYVRGLPASEQWDAIASQNEEPCQ